MTHFRHVTHAFTAARIERIAKLIAALQDRPRTRDEIGALLKMGPSGVRKYLVDLRGTVEFAGGAEPVFRLTLSAKRASAYLESLKVQAPSRPAVPRKSQFARATDDPSRHFHILADDEHHMPRLQRGVPAHEPVMAHFYGMARAEARV